jgi:hypothetical protein
VAFATESSKTTDGAEVCLDACPCLYSRQLSGFEWRK